MHGSLKTFRGSEPVHNQRKERESKRERESQREMSTLWIACGVNCFIITKTEEILLNFFLSSLRSLRVEACTLTRGST